MAARIKALWCSAVIEKNVPVIVNLYSKNAIFKGTYMNAPVKDKKLIKEYFTDFSKIVNRIVFLEDSVSVRKNDLVTEIGSYKFYTTKGIVTAQYNFVFKTDKGNQKIISHFSTPINK